MRLEQVEEGKKIKGGTFLDYVDCGDFYLLVDWCNFSSSTVTLNNNPTMLEDLHKKHRGFLNYYKICKTPSVYMGQLEEQPHQGISIR